MSEEQVIKSVESVIKKICKDIKKKGCGSEKIGRLSQLINAYNRLIKNDEAYDQEKYGIPGFHDRLHNSPK